MSKRMKALAASGVVAYATGVVIMWDRIEPLLTQVLARMGAVVGL